MQIHSDFQYSIFKNRIYCSFLIFFSPLYIRYIYIDRPTIRSTNIFPISNENRPKDSSHPTILVDDPLFGLDTREKLAESTELEKF